MNNINDIKHAFYINLDTRPDRKEHVKTQLNMIGIKADRFKAIKLNNGAIGCSMSHLKLLENAKKNNLPHILIVEDDILFTKPSVFIENFNKFLTLHKMFDVVLLAGNNLPPFFPIDNTCVRVTTCQTTTGYLVLNHYFDILIENYKKGIEKLIQSPNEHRLYAIDKYWFNLQRRDKWYLIIPLTVSQKRDYSDIEKKLTDYSIAMLDLEKKNFFKKQIKEKMTKIEFL